MLLFDKRFLRWKMHKLNEIKINTTKTTLLQSTGRSSRRSSSRLRNCYLLGCPSISRHNTFKTHCLFCNFLFNICFLIVFLLIPDWLLKHDYKMRKFYSEICQRILSHVCMEIKNKNSPAFFIFGGSHFKKIMSYLCLKVINRFLGGVVKGFGIPPARVNSKVLFSLF